MKSTVTYTFPISDFNWYTMDGYYGKNAFIKKFNVPVDKTPQVWKNLIFTVVGDTRTLEFSYVCTNENGNVHYQCTSEDFRLIFYIRR